METCPAKLTSWHLRKMHMIEVHRYPKSFKFRKLTGRTKHPKTAAPRSSAAGRGLRAAAARTDNPAEAGSMQDDDAPHPPPTADGAAAMGLDGDDAAGKGRRGRPRGPRPQRQAAAEVEMVDAGWLLEGFSRHPPCLSLTPSRLGRQNPHRRCCGRSSGGGGCAAAAATGSAGPAAA